MEKHTNDKGQPIHNGDDILKNMDDRMLCANDNIEIVDNRMSLHRC